MKVDPSQLDELEYQPTLFGQDEPRTKNKLTAAEVLEIKTALDRGTPQVELARKYGVDKSTISSININKTWRHLAETVVTETALCGPIEFSPVDEKAFDGRGTKAIYIDECSQWEQPNEPRPIIG